MDSVRSESIPQPNNSLQKYGRTSLVLPPGGATFRIDSTSQLARAAGTRTVYSLPFYIRDDATKRRARLKVWFSPRMELNVCLILSREEEPCCLPINDKTVARKTCAPLLFTSGRLFNQSQGVFYELWSLNINQSYNLPRRSDISSGYCKLEEIFPLKIALKSPINPHYEKSCRLNGDIAEMGDSFLQNPITIEQLTTSGLVCDNALILVWDVTVM